MREMLKQAIQKDSVIKSPTSRTLPLPLGVGLGVLLLFVGIVGGRILFGNNTSVPTAPTIEIAVVTATATPLPPTATRSPTSTPQATNTVKPTFSPTPTTIGTSTPNSDQSIYIVQEGDTLLTIAEKNNTTVDELRALNNLTSNFIYVGQELKVPSQVVQTSDTSGDTVVETEAAPAEGEAAPAEEEVPAEGETTTEAPAESASTTTTDTSGNIIHVVQANESVYKIAQKYEGVSPQDILNANNLTNPTVVVPGQELIIPIK